ncbi:MAG: winged helix-turn-helix domain-containing protein [Marinospirillum sp.]|uniref:winged helix-turn-helix domain-containing protein n=1 Tax=Marinospirillum sp. TaxID=2183934 RepID=UPI0019FC65C3|nr:winged helix-turn-helix domain-containing protein [Marinospirillum sp.]MBE0508020.1 winged helix-turn-helix domain-containing protein [Marinospirillum sp.]
MSQLSLFHVQQAYQQDTRVISNVELYERLSDITGIPNDSFAEKRPVGQTGEQYSLLKRKVRWHQQTLKEMGVITRVQRGHWKIMEQSREKLEEILPGHIVLAYSTKLGVGLWADNTSVFAKLGEPIHLCLTSPPGTCQPPLSQLFKN